MRALPVGWSVPVGELEHLIEATVELSRATHRDPDAQAAACVVAGCGAWALEGADAGLLLEIARETAAATAGAFGGGRALSAQLATLTAGTWSPPPAGVSMDPNETVVAALSCVKYAGTLREALLMAVRLGGDTDTVAALVGGLLGCQMSREDVLAALPWSGLVRLPAPAELSALAEGLASNRVEAASGVSPAGLA